MFSCDIWPCYSLGGKHDLSVVTVYLTVFCGLLINAGCIYFPDQLSSIYLSHSTGAVFLIYHPFQDLPYSNCRKEKGKKKKEEIPP